jgi:MoaE-MoaD fusion protein
MQIQVLYFAVFRERIGSPGEEFEIADGATVRDAIAALAAKHPPIAQLRGRFRVAVNQEFVDDTHVLRDRDEIALIPPVAGGASCRHVELTDRTLSLDRCMNAVRGEGMGGLVTFTGMVRLHSRGTTIDHLEYEAYAPMAIKVMTELCDEIEAEIPGTRVAVEHRVGHLQIGDIAVVIAAIAPRPSQPAAR